MKSVFWKLFHLRVLKPASEKGFQKMGFTKTCGVGWMKWVCERVGRGILYGRFLHQSCAHRIRILFIMQARPLPLRRRPPTSLRCARGCREGLLRRRPRTSLRRRRPAAPNSVWLPAWCHRRTSSPSLRILHLRRGSRRPSHPCPPST